MASLQHVQVKGHSYWRIVESRRVNGKPRPFVIAHLGKADDLRQVGVAILSNREQGIPLFHQVHGGKTPDVHSFAQALPAILKQLQNLGQDADKLTVVYAKGNMSLRNQGAVNRLPLHYVASLTVSSQRALLAEANARFEEVERHAGIGGIEARLLRSSGLPARHGPPLSQLPQQSHLAGYLPRDNPPCLRAEDRRTTAFGLENCVPFYDHRLAEFMFRVPGIMKIRDGRTNHLLRDAMRGVLPEETRTRTKKVGWNAPAHQWFAGAGLVRLKDMVEGRRFRASATVARADLGIVPSGEESPFHGSEGDPMQPLLTLIRVRNDGVSSGRGAGWSAGGVSVGIERLQIPFPPQHSARDLALDLMGAVSRARGMDPGRFRSRAP